MSTPQRRRWPGFSLTPRSENQRSTTTTKGLSSNTRIGDGSLGMGKSVAFQESSPPASATAYENSRGPTDEESDPVGLAEMVTKLENEDDTREVLSPEDPKPTPKPREDQIDEDISGPGEIRSIQGRSVKEGSDSKQLVRDS
ncbi:hypothetical protein Dimus_011585 [Dionaea muscipula]